MSRGSPFPLFRLPEDILGLIFAYLPISDLARCSTVSKRFCRIASSNAVWICKIKQYHLLRLDSDAMDENNWEDLKKHLSFSRWISFRRWCSPEALHLSASEFRDVHEQFVRAARDLEVNSLEFRGKRYPLVRAEVNPDHHWGWWWSRPRAAIKVLTPEYKFNFHLPVPPPTAAPAHVCVDNDRGLGVVAKTIVRRRDILLTNGRAGPVYTRRPSRDGAREDTRTPAAAIVEGVVLRVPPPTLPLVPAPEAHQEVGHAKFAFRHAYLKFYDLCPLCARNRSSDCNGDIPPFCRPCWLTHDLNLYMSAAQAQHEYGMTAADLGEAHKRYVDGSRTGNKQYHKRGCITAAESASAAPSPAPSPSPSVSSSVSAAPVAPDTAFYREFDVAYLALLKYGSVAAIQRRRAERSAGEEARLIEDEALLEAERIDTPTEQRRKRRIQEEDAADGNFHAAAPRAKAARSAKRRSPRKAARGKFYGEVTDEIDTRIAESTLGDVLQWRVMCS